MTGISLQERNVEGMKWDNICRRRILHIQKKNKKKWNEQVQYVQERSVGEYQARQYVQRRNTEGIMGITHDVFEKDLSKIETLWERM